MVRTEEDSLLCIGSGSVFFLALFDRSYVLDSELNNKVFLFYIFKSLNFVICYVYLKCYRYLSLIPMLTILKKIRI